MSNGSGALWELTVGLRRLLWGCPHSLEQGSAVPKGWGCQAAPGTRVASGSVWAVKRPSRHKLRSACHLLPVVWYICWVSTHYFIPKINLTSGSRITTTTRVCAYLLCLPILIYYVRSMFFKHFIEYFPSVIRNKIGLQFCCTVAYLLCGIKKTLFTALSAPEALYPCWQRSSPPLSSFSAPLQEEQRFTILL